VAIATVQSVITLGTGTTTLQSADITTTGGNLFIVDVGFYKNPNGFSSITDNKSNTFITAIAEVNSSTDANSSLTQQYKENGAGGSAHHFILTMTGSNSFMAFCVKEVSGALASGSLDQQATKVNNSGTTGLTSTATPTLSQADELLAGIASGSDNASEVAYTAQSGFTQDQENDNNGVSASPVGLLSASKVVSSTAAATFTFDVSLTSNGVMGAISTWKAIVPPTGFAAVDSLMQSGGYVGRKYV
jgi:hypothetical protein